jgi:hypothetical protein
MSHSLKMMKDKRKVTCTVEYFSHFETKFEQNKKVMIFFRLRILDENKRKMAPHDVFNISHILILFRIRESEELENNAKQKI